MNRSPERGILRHACAFPRSLPALLGWSGISLRDAAAKAQGRAVGSVHDDTSGGGGRIRTHGVDGGRATGIRPVRDDLHKERRLWVQPTSEPLRPSGRMGRGEHDPSGIEYALLVDDSYRPANTRRAAAAGGRIGDRQPGTGDFQTRASKVLRFSGMNGCSQHPQRPRRPERRDRNARTMRKD
jgi:hypothetical protein